jgi:hypothetical protein
MDQVWTLNRVVREARRLGLPVCTAFFDIEKAYDCVDREMLFKLLRRYGVNGELVDLIEAMYKDTAGRVAVGTEYSREFAITTGVRQGCLLSCILFDVVMDAVVRQFLAECEQLGVPLEGGMWCTGLLYADDLVCLAPSPENLQKMVNAWDRIAMSFGLVTSVKKTEVMYFGFDGPVLTLRGEELKTVTKFRYLGCLITTDLSWESELRARIGSAQAAWARHRATVFLNTRLSMKIRTTQFKQTVVVALLYGAETWTMTAAQLDRLRVTYMFFLRQMAGFKWWMRRSNDEVLARTEMPTWERYAASRSLRWWGHVMRQDGEERLTKMVLTNKINKEEYNKMMVQVPTSRVPGVPFEKCVARAVKEAVCWWPGQMVPQYAHPQVWSNRKIWTRFSSPVSESKFLWTPWRGSLPGASDTCGSSGGCSTGPNGHLHVVC